MKKKIPILMLGIAVMLASCSQDEDALQSTGGEPITVTFTATPDGSMTQRAMKTRAVTDPTDEPIARAVLDIYDEYNVQVGDRINGVIDGDNITFTAKLEENKTYTCLFWADEGDEAYDIDNLKAIKRKDAGTPSIAYYATTTIQAQSGTENVTLTHAVAKVVLFETGTLAEGDQVGVSFTMPEYTFNVADGSFDTDGSNRDPSVHFSITSDETTGQIGWFYFFAPAAGTELTTVTLYYTPPGGSERSTEIPNVPLKMNHRTVLKGEFAKIGIADQGFNIALDKNWEGDMQMLITTAAGQITQELIESALNADGSLVIEGPVNADDIYTVGYWAQTNSGKLISLDLSATTGLTEISDDTFYDATSLTSVILPSSLEKIGDGAFYNAGLTAIEIPNSVTSISGYAFNSSKLTAIEIPNSVTSIGVACFAQCNALASVTLPEGLTAIMNGTFSACSALKEITIPASVASIGQYALYTPALKTLVFEGDMEVVSSTEEDPAAQAGKLVLNQTITFYSGFNVFLPKITDKDKAETYKTVITSAKAVYYGYTGEDGGDRTNILNYTKYE